MKCQLFEPAGIAGYESRADWEASSVDLLAAVLTRWDLVPGRILPGGYSGIVLAVTCADGSPAVLKVGYPHAEAQAEAVALQSYPPGSAPRVLRQDPWAWAMLLERIDPGTPLLGADLDAEEAVRVGADLLARISAVPPAEDVPELSTVVRGYAAVARSRWNEQLPAVDQLGATELLAEALDELDALADGGSRSMVHGDYNPGNILRSAAGWVVIDPKPMVGDFSYDLWPLVSQLGSPFTRSSPSLSLTERLAIASRAAGCDEDRAARWAFARSGLNVSWYLEEGNDELAASSAKECRIWSMLR